MGENEVEAHCEARKCPKEQVSFEVSGASFNAIMSLHLSRFKRDERETLGFKCI